MGSVLLCQVSLFWPLKHDQKQKAALPSLYSSLFLLYKLHLRGFPCLGGLMRKGDLVLSLRNKSKYRERPIAAELVHSLHLLLMIFHHRSSEESKSSVYSSQLLPSQIIKSRTISIVLGHLKKKTTATESNFFSKREWQPKQTGRKQLLTGAKHRRKAVILLSIHGVQMIYYLLLQTASKYQAIQQEGFPSCQIVWL